MEQNGNEGNVEIDVIAQKQGREFFLWGLIAQSDHLPKKG